MAPPLPKPLPPAHASTSSTRPNGQPSPGTVGNTTGIITPKPSPNGAIENGQPTKLTDPPVAPETPKEAGFWSKAGPWVHGVLGVASFVPGLSVVTGGADAAIYTAEGNYLEAGLSAASMIPGGKEVVTAGKLVKGAVGLAKGAHEAEEVVQAARLAKAAEEAAKAEKVAKELREAEEAAKLRKAEKEAEEAKKAEGGGKDGGYNRGKGKKGPCDHLKKGNSSGQGDYRGGSYGGTRSPGIESHHMPADSVSPLPRSKGPAIQMDPADHARTLSHGRSGLAGIDYRAELADLLADGKWRDAIAREIQDARSIAQNSGDPSKYNAAIKEMLAYYKCLEMNKLLP